MKRWCQMSAETFNDMGRNLTLQPNMAASTFPESLCFCSENVQLSGSQSTKFQPRRPTWTSMPWTKSFGWSSMQLQDMGFQTWFRERPFLGQVEIPQTPHRKKYQWYWRNIENQHKITRCNIQLLHSLPLYHFLWAWEPGPAQNLSTSAIFRCLLQERLLSELGQPYHEQLTHLRKPWMSSSRVHRYCHHRPPVGRPWPPKPPCCGPPDNSGSQRTWWVGVTHPEKYIKQVGASRSSQ